MNKKRIALVTETGNGLGKTFANILCNEGLEVILAAKSESYKELVKSSDYRDEFNLIETDFTSDASVEKLKTHIYQIYGRLDVLVNNAEIANGFGQKIEYINLKEVKELYEENLFSVIRVIKTLYPLLLKSQSANIVNITSALGSQVKMKDKTFCYTDYQMTAYSTAKAALDMLTVLLAKELKHTNISINSFDPVLMKNSSHNSVIICKKTKQHFLKYVLP
ncbi:SDR family NAD(P)-dependent oxidoreductase [uncultured Aquimarina sp.]|uniref:SDR family NAD(P)-dependent oxidoreductase n=1 Tax=uncultured Aquimarina sp. TaxID=575652 RepID=UPI00262D5A2A|nr:SDR family NAD(P)-dependent oxidoreductase [uncultured Aquimarina sp.]